ncbi:cytochrome P450 6A1 [Apis mellifera carnica]|nr:cytochrome P450 6A1 [Apis mellifera carnica]
MNYLAFSNGPRNCIGARFANYQVKIGLIMILRNYKVEVCEKTVIPYPIRSKFISIGSQRRDIFKNNESRVVVVKVVLYFYISNKF